MKKEKRFYIKSNFGHWAVIDRNNGKQVVGYSKKTQAEKTADGLNRIRKQENVSKMKDFLKTDKGYGYYVRNSK